MSLAEQAKLREAISDDAARAVFYYDTIKALDKLLATESAQTRNERFSEFRRYVEDELLCNLRAWETA